MTWPGGDAAFELGAAAMKWIDKIRNPPSRIDKLEIKTGQKVLFVGLRDPPFERRSRHAAPRSWRAEPSALTRSSSRPTSETTWIDWSRC